MERLDPVNLLNKFALISDTAFTGRVDLGSGGRIIWIFLEYLLRSKVMECFPIYGNVIFVML